MREPRARTVDADELVERGADLLRSVIEGAEPVGIVEAGRVAAVLLDVDRYHRLLAEADRGRAVLGVRSGIADAAAGRIRPEAEVLADLARRFG